MAIALRAVGTTAIMAAGSITLTLPAGVQNGDLLIANVLSTDVSAANPQTGWHTIIITQPRSGEDWAFYWRIAASEPASYTWSWGASGGVGNITSFTGVDTTTPIDVSAVASAAVTSGTTLTAPTVTTATDNAWLVTAYASRALVTFSQPTNMTEQYDIQNATVSSTSLDTELRATAGATGTRASTVSATITFGRAVAFGLRAGATAPAAPTLGVITAGNAQLSAAFTAGSDGGSSITSYKYSTDNGATYLTRQSGTTASPIVITTLSSDGTTPLTNGTSYTVLIKAVNAVGDGTASNAVSATPATTPDAPTALVATGGNQQVSVAFTAGATGGSALTSYKYSTDNGATYRTRQTGTTASPVLITTLSSDGTTPLSNGVTYQIRIKAVNAIGDGTASSAVSGTPSNPTTDLKAALTMRVGGL